MNTNMANTEREADAPPALDVDTLTWTAIQLANRGNAEAILQIAEAVAYSGADIDLSALAEWGNRRGARTRAHSETARWDSIGVFTGG